MNNVVYINENNTDDEKSVQRFYVFSEDHGEFIHSTVDVYALFDLFSNKDINLSEDTVSNLSQAVKTAVDDFYCNFKAELSLHQLLTIMALHCSYSKCYKEFKQTHPERSAGFSYFIIIIKNAEGEHEVRDNILAIDRMISGDLLDDILDGMIKNHKHDMRTETNIASIAQ